MHHLFPEGTLTREHEEKVPAMKWNDIPSPLLSLLNFMAWNTQSKNTSTHFRKYLTVGREEKFNQSEVSTHFSFWEDFYPHNESKPAALYITAVKKCVFLSKKLLPMTFNFIKKKRISLHPRAVSLYQQRTDSFVRHSTKNQKRRTKPGNPKRQTSLGLPSLREHRARGHTTMGMTQQRKNESWDI